MLKNEQDNLEPQKRRKMQEIMNLTQEAFEMIMKRQKEACGMQRDRKNKYSHE